MRRDHDRRPARASGMVPPGRTARRAATTPAGSSVVLVGVVCSVYGAFAVRAGEQTRAPAPHRSRCDVRLGSRPALSRAALVPRPQNPTGPAWRIVKVQQTRRSADDPDIVDPTTRRSSRPRSRRGDDVAVVMRSSNLVRSRLPTSHEISQPAGGLVTASLAVWSPPHWRKHWQRDG